MYGLVNINYGLLLQALAGRRGHYAAVCPYCGGTVQSVWQVYSLYGRVSLYLSLRPRYSNGHGRLYSSRRDRQQRYGTHRPWQVCAYPYLQPLSVPGRRGAYTSYTVGSRIPYIYYSVLHCRDYSSRRDREQRYSNGPAHRSITSATAVLCPWSSWSLVLARGVTLAGIYI